jgi:hypothetical protein
MWGSLTYESTDLPDAIEARRIERRLESVIARRRADTSKTETLRRPVKRANTAGFGYNFLHHRALQTRRSTNAASYLCSRSMYLRRVVRMGHAYVRLKRKLNGMSPTRHLAVPPGIDIT